MSKKDLEAMGLTLTEGGTTATPADPDAGRDFDAEVLAIRAQKQAESEEKELAAIETDMATLEEEEQAKESKIAGRSITDVPKDKVIMTGIRMAAAQLPDTVKPVDYWLDGGARGRLGKVVYEIFDSVRQAARIYNSNGEEKDVDRFMSKHFSTIDAVSAGEIIAKLGVLKKDIDGEMYSLSRKDPTVGLWTPIVKSRTGNVETASFGEALEILNWEKSGDSRYINSCLTKASRQMKAEQESWHHSEAVCYNGVYDQKAGEFYPWGHKHIQSRFYRRKIMTAFYKDMAAMVKHWEDDGLIPDGWKVYVKDGFDGKPDLYIEAYGDVWACREWIRDLFVRDIDVSYQAIMYSIQFMVREDNPGKIVLLINNENEARGHNGKTTLLAFLLTIIGAGWYSTLKMEELEGEGNSFEIQKLSSAVANISDESASATTIIQATATLRALLTGAPVSARIKNSNANFQIQNHRMFFQAMNGLPRIMDETGALDRRILALAFEKCFDGINKAYIKDHFSRSPIVAEFLVWYVLTQMPYAEEYPKEVIDGLAQYQKELQLEKDPAKHFISLYVDGQLTENTIPARLIYDAFSNWYTEMMGEAHRQKCISPQKFYDKLAAYLRDSAQAMPYELVNVKKDGGSKIRIPDARINNFLPQNIVSLTTPEQGWRASDADRAGEPDAIQDALTEADCIFGDAHRKALIRDRTRGGKLTVDGWKPWESQWGKRQNIYLRRKSPVGMGTDSKGNPCAEYLLSPDGNRYITDDTIITMGSYATKMHEIQEKVELVNMGINVSDDPVKELE